MWLKKAMTDLKTAKKLFREDEPILDTSVYHTQQCAEKAFKGYLAFKKQPIQKTHDLAVLVEICGQLDEEFRKFMDDAAILGPYCDAFRYPGNQDEPDVEEAADAITRAEKILSFVEGIIKNELKARGEETDELFK